MKKLNIAIAGTGFGQKVHLPALIESENLITEYFYHHNKNKIYEIEKQTGLKGYSNWDELLNNKNIDGIIIATPPDVRFELARKALLKKKHLLLEKPVGINTNEIKELQRLSLINNLIVCVDFEYRAVPLFLQAKEIIEQKKIGPIYFVKFDWIMSSRSDPKREWNWYSLSEKGGGVIGALGTHAIDILHWLVGSTNKVSGYISTSIKVRPKGNSLEKVTSEDVCLANLELTNNICKKIPCQLSLSSISRNGKGFNLEIYGRDGSLFLNSKNQKDYVHGFTLKYSNNKNEMLNIKPNDEFLFEETWDDGRIAPVKRIHKWWSNSINGNTPIIPGLSEGLKSHMVCEGIKESSISGFTKEIT